MKIALAGLCLGFALAAAPAFADQPAKPRFKMNGDVCTAEEVAYPPVVKVRYRATVAKVKVQCLTRAEWRLMETIAADKKRYAERERQAMNDTYNTAPEPVS